MPKKSPKEKVMEAMTKAFLKRYPYITEGTVDALVELNDHKTVGLLLPHYLEKEKVNAETVEYHLQTAKRLKEAYNDDAYLRTVSDNFVQDAKNVLKDFHSQFVRPEALKESFKYIVRGYSVLGNHKDEFSLNSRSELYELFDGCMDLVEGTSNVKIPYKVLECADAKGAPFKIVDQALDFQKPSPMIEPVPHKRYRVIAHIPDKRIDGEVVVQFGIRHASLDKKKKLVSIMDGKTFGRRNFSGHARYRRGQNISVVEVDNFYIEADYERPYLRKLFFKKKNEEDDVSSQLDRLVEKLLK